MNVAIDGMRADENHGVDISSRRSRHGLFYRYYFDQAELFRQALSSKACGMIMIRYLLPTERAPRPPAEPDGPAK
jgi:hypothetical protein